MNPDNGLSLLALGAKALKEKLNPPIEKRNKKIELSELKDNIEDFKKELDTKFEILDKNIPQINPKIIEKTNNSENIDN